jgi:hypothetical protein
MLTIAGDLGRVIVGFVLTLFVFSYLIRDNPLFRLAVHVLVGVSAAYAVVITLRQVLLPALRTFLQAPFSIATLGWLIPIALAVMLLLKAVPRTARLGNSAMAILVAVGAAVGLVGAVIGTLLPLIASPYENRLLGLVASLVAIAALAAFYFTDRIPPGTRFAMPASFGIVRTFGQAIIVAALAGLFAALLNSSLALLVERVGFYLTSFAEVFSGLGA